MERREFTLNQLKDSIVNAKPMISMFSELNPGDHWIHTTEDWHQGALFYLITNYFPQHPEYEVEYKLKTIDIMKKTGLFKNKEKQTSQTIFSRLNIRRL